MELLTFACYDSVNGRISAATVAKFPIPEKYIIVAATVIVITVVK